MPRVRHGEVLIVARSIPLLFALLLVVAPGCSLALDFGGFTRSGDGGGIDASTIDAPGTDAQTDAPEVDAPMDDAGPVDAPPDSPMDSGPPLCVTSADCDDGVFCNGPEPCDSAHRDADFRGCVPSTGDPCLTGQMCDEAVDRCLSACEIDPDVDGDGHDAIGCPGGDDCDDADPMRHPGRAEVCDPMHDEDCDLDTVGPDADMDGVDAAGCCNVVGASSTCGTDCDDARATTFPGAAETCNGRDDDCDMTIDDGVQSTFYRDMDMDTFGNAAMSMMACTAPAGHVANSTDCDDTRATTFPGAAETCNTRDDNCNGMTDEGVTTTFYRDMDMDTFGNPAMPMSACSAPAGFVANNQDCDDTNSMRRPGAMELCNGIDDDCDMMIDDGAGTTWFRDNDGDNYGIAAATMVACARPAGFAPMSGDCNDASALVNPGATETCNGVDDDCDAAIDDNICVWGCGAGGACDDPIASTAGFEHQCVLRASGSVWCVGSNEFGELGIMGGPGMRSLAWVEVRGMPPARAIAAGDHFTCAIAGAADEVYCWGRNDLGQLGDGTTTTRFMPARVTTGGAGLLSGAMQLSSGAAHSCVMRSSTVWCWGANSSLQLGMSGGGLRANQVPGISGRAVSAGNSHTCAIDSGSLAQCWGSNSNGELGRGFTSGPHVSPASVVTLPSDVAWISAGRNFSCAVRAAGSVHCWGLNAMGQLGNGMSTTMNTAPTAVVTAFSDFVAVDAGYQSACALRRMGELMCWGANSDGQVGDGTTTTRLVAVATAGSHLYASVDATGAFVSSLSRTGSIVRAWGFNSRGQLGDRTTTSRSTPTQVVFP
jgi:alpha-tubulin suppressor-like RCC1 family protein